MIRCGSQCWLCDLPVRFDNYKGCTHGCKYCFVQRGNDDAFKVSKNGTIEPLKKFIEGERNKYVNWVEKVGADFCYPVKLLEGHFYKIKEKTHELGMSFYCGENRLRKMGDSLTCCGVDGLEGFKPNVYNLNHILNGDKKEPTEAMKKEGTADCFNTLEQTSICVKKYSKMSFAEGMMQLYGNKKAYVDSVLGVKK